MHECFLMQKLPAERLQIHIALHDEEINFFLYFLFTCRTTRELINYSLLKLNRELNR